MVINQVIFRISGKGHVPEEIQQPPNFWEVVHQGHQGCTNPILGWSGPETCVWVKKIIRKFQQEQKRFNLINQGITNLYQGSSILGSGMIYLDGRHIYRPVREFSISIYMVSFKNKVDVIVKS